MNLYNDMSRDPTNAWNYVMHAMIIDTSKGITENEKRWYSIAKVAAIAIKVFLAIATCGISAMINHFAVMFRGDRYDVEAIKKASQDLNKGDVRRPEILSRILYGARLLAQSAQVLEQPKDGELRGQVEKFAIPKYTFANVIITEDEIDIIVKALENTPKVERWF